MTTATERTRTPSNSTPFSFTPSRGPVRLNYRDINRCIVDEPIFKSRRFADLKTDFTPFGTPGKNSSTLTQKAISRQHSMLSSAHTKDTRYSSMLHQSQLTKSTPRLRIPEITAEDQNVVNEIKLTRGFLLDSSHVPFKSKPGQGYEEMKRSNMIETVFKFTPALHWKNTKKPKKDLSAPRKTIAINNAFQVHQSRDVSSLKEKFKRLSSARFSDKPKDESPPRFGHRRSQSERTIKSALPQPKKEKPESDVFNKDSIAIFTRELKNHNRFYVDYLVEPKEKFSSAKDLQLNIRPATAVVSDSNKYSRAKLKHLANERSPSGSPYPNSTPNHFENEETDPDAPEKIKSFKSHIKRIERHNSKLEMQQVELNQLFDNVSRKKSMSQDEKEFMKYVQKNNTIEVKQIIENAPKVVRFTDLRFQTPLHIAIKKENFQMVQKLLQHGADLTARDESGNTPLDLAEKLGNKKIIESIQVSQRSRSPTSQ